MILERLGRMAAGLVIAAYAIAIPATLLGNRIEPDHIGKETKRNPIIVLMEETTVFRNMSVEKIPTMIEIETMLMPAIWHDRKVNRLPRYAGISMSDEERQEFASIVYLEAGNQTKQLQQAIAEVILNRVISPDFPNTVHDVLYQGAGTRTPQFSPIGVIHKAEPAAAQYDAIDAALYGPSILPDDVVFFSLYGENERVWGEIQDVVFCHEYIWE